MEEENVGLCRLCGKKRPLQNSHFIPKSIIKAAKRDAGCAQIYRSDAMGTFQDGLKQYFLCKECESLFCSYEKIFFETVYNQVKTQDVINYDNQKVKYFILSVAWRYIQYRLEKDQEKISCINDDEEKVLMSLPYCGERPIDIKNDIRDTCLYIDSLKTLLLEERHKEIELIQMHMIPTQRIIQLQSRKRYMKFCTAAMGLSFHKFDKYECVSIQIPRLMILCTINGINQSLDQFEVGKPIEKVVDVAVLPQNYFDILLSSAKLVQKAYEINE